MRILYHIALLTVAITVSSTAQVIELSESQISHEETLYPSIRVEINPEPNAVKKAWSNYMQDDYGVKMKGFGFLANKDVLYAEESTIHALSQNPLNFYTRIVQSGEETTLEVFAGETGGTVIDPDKDSAAFQTMRQMTVSFLDDFLTEYYREQVKQKQEEVNDLADELEDLKSDIGNSEKRIEKLRKEIHDLEKEIEEDRREIMKKEEELVEEKTSLEMKKRALETIRKRLLQIQS